ncbi:ATP-binding protein [Streptomyces sp. NBC_00347]|uniref:AAA family ATPase n=1 Tax=Streptomyces sp. NBC_00347 TaxID=2975721 RepID=UPI00224CFFBC|nr:ATP-binding protein [Streptomyces sp. NBC_00347]MCX5126856.1 ATP-binding protein [Streptomyces sp. NBC_00347]MCX5128278.1 ATP-binding protein [Streptomyces sp. NBC_00347]MCX5128289.1 ATP-binding protein [Streptomyces sp. NBC_00347]
MIDNAFVVVSGLPASGKSTLARRLAAELGWSVIDKDAILESLYDSLGVGDHAWRYRLSRASDDILFTLAAQARHAVLDNWWHHDTAPGRLHQLDARIVEVHCDCHPALVAKRFQTRTRHPGHLDQDLTREEITERVAAWAALPGPLRLGGPLLTIDTSQSVDITALAKEIDTLLLG